MTASPDVVSSPGPRSYLELEITGETISIYERMGDGATDQLVEALEKLGLKLRVRVSSPCG